MAEKPDTLPEEMPVVRMQELSLHYGKTVGIDRLTLEIPSRKLIGLIGPDGVGKSTLLSLVTGAHIMQSGSLEVLGGDMRDVDHRNLICFPFGTYCPAIGMATDGVYRFPAFWYEYVYRK